MNPAPETAASAAQKVQATPEPAEPRAAAVHEALERRFAQQIEQREAESGRLSLVRLVFFLGAGTLITIGLSQAATVALVLGVAAAIGFAAAVVVQQRVHAALDAARIRRDVHARHLARIGGGWTAFENRGEHLLPRDHPYAWDIDLLGAGSLFQRIDVTRTLEGERLLADWLGVAGSPDQIRARQVAVAELAEGVELRQELEAAARAARGNEKLNGQPFREFAELPSYFATRRWLVPLIFALPLACLGCYLLGAFRLAPPALWLIPLIAQASLLWATGKSVRRTFDLAAARQGVVESFERMLLLVERARFEAPLLRALQARLNAAGIPPSSHMRSLRRWSSCAELRQHLFYVVVNPLTLWDLHVLRGLEAWNARAGRHTREWFLALGELEALCSLATLAFCDPAARTPEIAPAGGTLRAERIVHPLLSPAAARVGNDVELAGPGHALIVTGSNMAGKSTLLRAVGVNVALALAGGPVCAESARIPLVRLRASMRAEDSLQAHASYFHAELQKLRTVVAGAEDQPPVLFLLDELLRGTNARARHVGARAVLLHLLGRGALGLVATHDVALSALELEYPGKIGNAHFTDVVEAGEMRFDYRLRPGVVRTSNALRLLALAGIDVPDDDAAAIAPLDTASSKPERS